MGQGWLSPVHPGGRLEIAISGRAAVRFIPTKSGDTPEELARAALVSQHRAGLPERLAPPGHPRRPLFGSQPKRRKETTPSTSAMVWIKPFCTNAGCTRHDAGAQRRTLHNNNSYPIVNSEEPAVQGTMPEHSEGHSTTEMLV